MRHRWDSTHTDAACIQCGCRRLKREARDSYFVEYLWPSGEYTNRAESCPGDESMRQKIIWVADDGTEFDSKGECEAHELGIGISKHILTHLEAEYPPAEDGDGKGRARKMNERYNIILAWEVAKMKDQKLAEEDAALDAEGQEKMREEAAD